MAAAKTSTPTLTLTLTLTLILTLPLSAKPRGKHVVREKVGQQYYLKACGGCHGPGKIGGNMATQAEWKDLIADGAKELIELHEGERNVTALMEYLKSPKFQKEHDRLLKFLQEFANDSESIPTCY
jgi:mono/diheme cytochrome c family protein